MSAGHRTVIFAGIVAIAAALRLPALDVRPMHADEAVHAAKLGQLLEKGDYTYDPEEYHGPTLNYLTLLPARARGQARYPDLDEKTLRVVPACAGVLLVAGHALLVPVIGFPAAAVAALLTAVSPAMVFYSRYYIQETLLVLFSFGAIVSFCRYARRPRMGWALGAGLSIGLMQSTKETWVIAVGGMAAAAVLARAVGRDRTRALDPGSGRRRVAHVAAGVISALGVSGLLLSSFLANPQGIVDSVLAYRTYLARAAGDTWHVHPWHYYFDLLLYARTDGSPTWTEAAIVVMAIVGLATALTRAGMRGTGRRPLAFVGLYALMLAAIYSSIPYKTPWCLLGFLHGFILLAGAGAAFLMHAARRAPSRAAAAVLLLAAAAHLGWQAWAGGFRYAADPRNPYVYAHTGTGVFDIAKHVEALARAHPDGFGMPVDVISGENLWPLPWYLRRLSDVRWQASPVRDAGHAPLILATPDMEAAIVRKLYEWRPPGDRELYVPLFETPLELRPRVEVRGYAAKSLWDAYERSRDASPAPAGAAR